MPSCTIDTAASPQFKTLCNRWRKEYPSIDSDLKVAFAAISQNILANKGRRTQSGGDVEVYKYRQNSTDIKRGQSYGWRIYALFLKSTGMMYPIIVYPKTHWEDADTTTVREAIKDIRLTLGMCINPSCNGKMVATTPTETAIAAEVLTTRTQCLVCRVIYWRPAESATSAPALPLRI